MERLRRGGWRAPRQRGGWVAAAGFLPGLVGTALVWAQPLERPDLGSELLGHELGKAWFGLKIVGADDREPVTVTTRFPWSAIGKVEGKWKLEDGRGIISRSSGVLIGHRTVLTVGHSLFKENAGGWADEYTFTPGKYGDQAPYGTARGTRAIAWTSLVEEQNSDFDLGIVVLDTPVGQEAGYMRIAVQPESYFDNRTLNTAGYPAGGDVMYFTAGTTHGMYQGHIVHDLDNEGGQSGSPVWILDPQSGERWVVGVMAYEGENYNYAVRIHGRFADWIEKTLAEEGDVVQNIPRREDSPVPTAPRETSNPPPMTAAPLCGLGMVQALSMAFLLMAGLRLGHHPVPILHGRRR